MTRNVRPTDQTGPPPASAAGAAGANAEARPHGFTRPPEPRALGNPARGERLISEADQGRPPGAPGFGWLDDLAASASAPARSLAQRIVLGWIAENPRPPETQPRPGQARQWHPAVTGRRVMRWLFHSGLILPGLDRDGAQPFFDSLHEQLDWLARSHGRADPGLDQIEALSGLALGAMALRGAEDHAEPALNALATACEKGLQNGALRARNPEALLTAFTDLGWVLEACDDHGMTAPDAIATAIQDIAPVLRALRHADGGLPRFHGGGRGAPGRLDHMLRHASGPAKAAPSPAMGFARMARARATLILDGAAPPGGADAAHAHASTLGIELTVARHPLVVSCGSGADFGPAWARASRATPCHSTLCLGGASSSRLATADEDGAERLTEMPRQAWAGACDANGDLLPADAPPGHPGQPARLLAGHDGWAPYFGVTHLRELWLSPGGDHVDGEDSLAAMDVAAQARLDRVLAEQGSIPFDIRFHLHPEVDARSDGDTIRLTLPNREEWYFSHDLIADLTLEPTAWLEPGAGAPAASQQIVLSHALDAHAAQISWTFMRAGVR